MRRLLTGITASALLLGLLCGVTPASAGTTGRPIVAVFNIEIKGVRLGRAVLDRLGGYLTTKLAASGAYKVIPRAQIKRRMTRQKRRSYRDCYAQSCQIQLGKELAATHSLSCKLLKIGRRCILTAELYDLRTATTSSAATARGRCSEDAVVGLIDRAVKQLTGGAGRVKGTAPAAPGAVMSLLSPAGTKVSGRQLKRVEIQRGVNRGMPAFQRCYEQGLLILPSLSGRVVLDFTIGAAGGVTSVKMESSSMGFPSVEACILKHAWQLRFPRPKGGGSVKVRYPFVFRVEGAQVPAPRSTTPRSSATAPYSLSRAQVQASMRRIRPQVTKCYDRFKKPGMVKVLLRIATSGAVLSAVIKGRFAGSPTGACVRAAVLRVRFPQFTGKPLTITYPFALR
jgi:TonB family protein